MICWLATNTMDDVFVCFTFMNETCGVDRCVMRDACLIDVVITDSLSWIFLMSVCCYVVTKVDKSELSRPLAS